jgi:hypothetical protein
MRIRLVRSEDLFLRHVGLNFNTFTPLGALSSNAFGVSDAKMWCLYCSDFCVGLLKGSWLIYCQHFSKDDKMAPQNVLRALSLLCNFTC